MWRLVIEGSSLALLDADREEVEYWRGADVLSAVKAPSFWESTKVYSVHIEGAWVNLDLDHDARAALQELLDRNALRQNPDMPNKAVLVGLAMLFGGATLFVGGILFMLQRFEEGKPYVFAVAPIIGGAMFFIGIGKIFSRGKWKRLAAKMEQEDDDRPRSRRRADDDA